MARRKGRKWLADGIDASGRRRRVTLGSEQSAIQYEENVLSYSGTNSVGELFPTWAKEIWQGTKNEYEALKLTARVVTALGPKTPIVQINRERIKKLTAELIESGNSLSTVNRKLSCLSKLLKYAVAEERLDFAPHIELKQDPDARRFRILDYDEEDRMLAAFEEEMDRQFTGFLLDTGARFGETQILEWRDHRHNERKVEIWKSKTGTPRTIPLTDRAFAALNWTKEQNWIRPWSGIVYRTFMQRWHKARVRAQLDPEVIPYVCRHTCATRLARGGYDAFRLMKWMGHSNIATTELYVKMAGEDLVGGVDILSRGRPQIRTV